MNIKLEKKEAFIVAGVKKEGIHPSQCHSVWQELFEEYSPVDYASLGRGESVGVCYGTMEPETINYMAGYIVTNNEKAKDMGLDLLEVKAEEYSVLSLKGPIPTCIQEGWKYAFKVFFPEEGYEHSGAPDFEYYYEGDMESADYEMELWIPVRKTV